MHVIVVVNAKIHAAPAMVMKTSEIGISVLRPMNTVEMAKAVLEMLNRRSLPKCARTEALSVAAISDPAPKPPSRSPYSIQPPPMRCCVISGASDQTALPPKPNKALRTKIAFSVGDMIV